MCRPPISTCPPPMHLTSPQSLKCHTCVTRVQLRTQREAARKLREERERQQGASGGAPAGRDKRDGGWLGGGEWVSMGELAPGADLDAALSTTLAGEAPTQPFL